MNVLCRPGDGVGRDLCINQVIGEAKRYAENEKDASDQQSALHHHPWRVTQNAQIAMEHGGGEKGVESRDGCCLNRGSYSAEECNGGDHRCGQLPLDIPECSARLSPFELPNCAAAGRASLYTPDGCCRHHDHG